MVLVLPFGIQEGAHVQELEVPTQIGCEFGAWEIVVGFEAGLVLCLQGDKGAVSEF